MYTQTNNNGYEKLVGIGTQNTRNRVNVSSLEGSTEIGVNIEQAGAKKAIELELLVPTTRSGKGTRRTTALKLNGAQARALYNTLSEFFANKE